MGTKRLVACLVHNSVSVSVSVSGVRLITIGTPYISEHVSEHISTYRNTFPHIGTPKLTSKSGENRH